MARTNTNTGGGGGGSVNSVTASSPLSSSGGANPNITLTQPVADRIWYSNNAGSLTSDNQATRDSTTKETIIGRDLAVTIANQYDVTIGTVIGIGSASGTPTDGETVTDLTSGATAVLEYHNTSFGIWVLTSIVGVISALDTLEGDTSGAQIGVQMVFPNNFVVSEAFGSINPVTSAPGPSGTIIATIPGGYTIEIPSNEIPPTVDLLIVDDPDSPAKVFCILTLSSPTPVTTNITTRFATLDDIGIGAGGTVLQSFDGSGAETNIGVFDASSFGGSALTAGIASENADGDQSNLFLFGSAGAWNSTNAAGDNANLVVFGGAFSLGAESFGGDRFAFEANGTNIFWSVGNNTFYLPKTVPTVDQVMVATFVSGNNVTLGWADNGGGGGNDSNDPQYSIQMSDGAGAFDSNANFLFNYSTNIPYWALDDGIIINSLSDYRFGKFLSGKKGFFDIDGGASPVMTYNTTATTASLISFSFDVPGGLDNLDYNSYNSYDDGTTSWIITVDGSGSGYSGITHSGGGSLSNLTINDPYGGDIPATVPVTYTVISKGDVYNAGDVNATITGTPVNGEQVTGGTSGATGYFIDYDVADDGTIYLYGVVGTFTPGETVTGATSGFTWVVGGGGINPDGDDWAILWNDSSVGNYYAQKAHWDDVNVIGNPGYELTINLHGLAATNPDGSTWTFGWDLPDGYMDWVIEPATGAFDEGETVAVYSDDWTGPTFTGTGLDNLSIYTGNYDGGPFVYTWTVTIDGVGVVDIWNVSGVTGLFADGDVFTFTSGGTATYSNVQSPFGGKAYFVNATGSINPGDVGTGPTGSLTLDSYDEAGDTFSWTDGAGSGSDVPVNGNGANPIGHGLYLNFGTAGGHTIGDFWTITHNLTLEGTGVARRTDIMQTYNHVYITEWSTVFTAGDYILGLTSNEWSTLDTFDGYGDTFTNNRNAVDVQTHQPILGLFAASNIGTGFNEVTVIWGSPNMHIIGDEWTFNFSQAEVARILADANFVSLGDIVGLQNLFQMNLQTGDTIINATNGFNVKAPGGANVLAVNTLNKIVHLGNESRFYVNVSDDNQEFQILGATNGTNFTVNDANVEVSYFALGGTWFKLKHGTGEYGLGDLTNDREKLLINTINKTVFLGASNTNDGNLRFDNDDLTSDWFVQWQQSTPTGFHLEGADNAITWYGTHIEPTMRTVVYNSSNGMNLSDYLIYVSGSTGLTSFDLDSVDFPIGQVLQFLDKDRIASTSVITLDAGTGNDIISATGGGQTYDIDWDGGFVTIKKILSDTWTVMSTNKQ